MTETMVEEITAKGIKVSEEEEETPSSGVGTWLIVGLSIGVLLCLGIALKRVIKWFKKGKPFCLFEPEIHVFKMTLTHFHNVPFQ